MKRPTSFSWDAGKHRSNAAKHAILFEVADKFEFETAMVAIDDRHNYGEVREVALGLIGIRVHTIVFTMRGPVCHVISLRKSNRREVERYVQNL